MFTLVLSLLFLPVLAVPHSDTAANSERAALHTLVPKTRHATARKQIEKFQNVASALTLSRAVGDPETDTNTNLDSDSASDPKAEIRADIAEMYDFIKQVQGASEKTVSALYNVAWARDEFQALKTRMADTCGYVRKEQGELEKLFYYFNLMAHVPLKPLSQYLKGLTEVATKLDKQLLKNPNQPICRAIEILQADIDGLNGFVRVALDKLGDLVEYTNYVFKGLDITVALYKHVDVDNFIEQQVSARALSVRSAVAWQCQAAPSLHEKLQGAAAASQDISANAEAISHEMGRVLNFTKNVLSPVRTYDDYVHRLFDGALGKVIDTMWKIFNATIRLPVPGGYKERGAGIVPRCCASGYKAGVFECFEKCKEGYEEINEGCWEKCPHGYKTLALTCTRLVPPSVKVRHNYARKKRGFNCGCNSKKNHMEDGLCYGQCGRGRYAGYATTIIDKCWDYSTKKIAVPDVMKYTKIFDKVDEIPLLGSAIETVNKWLDDMLRPILSLVDDLADVKRFHFNFDLDSFKFGSRFDDLNRLTAELNVTAHEIDEIKQNPQCP